MEFVIFIRRINKEFNIVFSGDTTKTGETQINASKSYIPDTDESSGKNDDSDDDDAASAPRHHIGEGSFFESSIHSSTTGRTKLSSTNS